MNQTRLVPSIVASALFIENADSAMVATALPTIASDLGVDPLALKLALTAYLIALGLVAIAVMLKAPAGFWGGLRARIGLELFPLSYRVVKD